MELTSNTLPSKVLTSSQLLHWDGKENLKCKLNYMAMLDLVNVQNVVLELCGLIMAFRTMCTKFHIPPRY